MECGEIEILDDIINYNLPQISDKIRFWMIRTKKGYFYEEYLKNEFVALGWNSIDKITDLSDELLPQHLKKDYGSKQPTKVINKCNDFINIIKKNDIIILPNRGLEEIAIVLAGDYFEVSDKDKEEYIEIEKNVSWKIDNSQMLLTNVECPYRKRRRITLLRRIKTDNINYHLYRTLRNYNGIDDIDEHAVLILGMLFDAFIYKNDINIILNVNQKNDIGLSELSGILYGSKEYFSHFVDKSKIKAKVNLSSEGQIFITLKEIAEFALNHGFTFIKIFLTLLVTQKIMKITEGPAFIKEIMALKEVPNQEKLKTKLIEEDLREKKLRNDLLEDELENKRIEAQKRLYQESINGLPNEFEQQLITNASKPLEIKSITLTEEAEKALIGVLNKNE